MINSQKFWDIQKFTVVVMEFKNTACETFKTKSLDTVCNKLTLVLMVSEY